MRETKARQSSANKRFTAVEFKLYTEGVRLTGRKAVFMARNYRAAVLAALYSERLSDRRAHLGRSQKTVLAGDGMSGWSVVRGAGEWEVHEGRPSWHQQRAGHISAAKTSGFKTEAEANEFAEKLKANHPDMPVFVLKASS